MCEWNCSHYSQWLSFFTVLNSAYKVVMMKGLTNSGYLHIHQKILCNVSIHLKSGFSYFLCHLVLGWESNPQWVYWSCNPEPKGSKKLCRAKGKCRMEILCSSLLVIVPHIVIWYKNSFQTNIFNSKHPFISFFNISCIFTVVSSCHLKIQTMRLKVQVRRSKWTLKIILSIVKNGPSNAV